jgi:hypothetical protein
MANLDRYRLGVAYKGLRGLSEMGFKQRKTLLSELFPTADEVILSLAGYFWKLDEAAAVLYEVPDLRFEVVETDHVVELAVPNPSGDYTGLIVDVLAIDAEGARTMLDDIETTCGLVKAKLRDAMRMMEMSEEDCLERLKDSMKLLANELRR